MGTYLHSMGLPPGRCVEEANLLDSELVERVHRSYIEAGARIIETNSFGANRIRLARYGMEEHARQLCRLSVEIARRAAKDRSDIFVAGSVGPLGITEDLSTESLEALEEQISALVEAGVDVIYLETQTTINEAISGLKISKRHYPQVPVATLLAPSEEGRISGGLNISEAFKILQAEGADCVGMNASLGPASTLRVLMEINSPLNVPIAVYPNAGKPQYLEGHYLFYATPEYFAKKCAEMVNFGVSIIGGCVGTTPEHIRELASLLLHAESKCQSPSVERVSIHKYVSKISEPEQLRSAATEKRRTLSLLEKYRQGIATIVELDTPKTLPLEKYFTVAKQLTDAGADRISLADNALAILRNSNLAVGAKMMNEGLPPLIHIACRDRNLIALQSELMGLHTLGLDHILVITGDPAKVGDHPLASSVYDLNSVGLIKIASQFNEGLTHSGRELKEKTSFLIGCSFNPNAINLDNQLRKLESKLKAGAHFVMTQPIFDVKLVERCAGPLSKFGVPIFLGVMPIMNERNAEFLNNEVPGITIPDEVRMAFRNLDRQAAKQMSVRISKRICEAVLSFFPGLYLITPGLHADLIQPLIPKR